MAELGHEEAAKVEQSMGLVEDAKFVAYVAAIGQRLVAISDLSEENWTFQVVATAEPNAFALPGGHIYLSRGLLALINSEDELAAVIGHEIGHVTGRHAANRMRASAVTSPLTLASGIAGAAVGLVSPMLGNLVGGVGEVISTGFVVAPFSRSQENEADATGQMLAARAGYDPAALAHFLHTLDRDEKLQRGKARKQSIMDYHPMTPDRVEKVSQRASTLVRGPSRPIAKTHSDLLWRLDGLVVDEDPKDGVFAEDNLFLQPLLDFKVKFPAAWDTSNTPQAVGARSPGEDAVIALRIAKLGSTLDAFVVELESADANLALERLEINGLPAARTWVSQRGMAERVTLIQLNETIFSLVGQTKQSDVARYGKVFDAVAGSFAALSDEDRNSIVESRLRVREALGGETPAALSKRLGSTWTGDRIAVANGLGLSASLQAKRPLKVALPQPFEATRP